MINRITRWSLMAAALPFAHPAQAAATDAASSTADTATAATADTAAAVSATPIDAGQPANVPAHGATITFGHFTATHNPAELAVSSYPSEAAGDGNATNGYNLSRWAEDWSKMCDARNRRDLVDRLKCIPFNSRHSIYLTLSGEIRERVNLTTNPGLLNAEGQRQEMLRLVGGADLHVGPYLRFYGEVAHGGLGGINLGSVTGTQKNDAIWL
ncbi:MAG TPA: hypothetical protein VFF98_12325, partial [Novosphingobium sp.]|nr:hypothetical protein [Novosphingobium sp.]